MKNSLRVHAALFLVALIYAANYSLSKDVMPEYMGPFGIVTLRIVGAALFFAVLSRLIAPRTAFRAAPITCAPSSAESRELE
ncbi:hypothetical protein [Hymenobacter qilianensis]|uniref:hypothetical protein n=1 Tax=Hymenobacter qilianensis TaxID=1385715 RepID=UPI001CB966B5|nr:hypothetical protein [Hymenobacter qilianensis]